MVKPLLAVKKSRKLKMFLETHLGFEKNIICSTKVRFVTNFKTVHFLYITCSHQIPQINFSPDIYFADFFGSAALTGLAVE